MRTQQRNCEICSNDARCTHIVQPAPVNQWFPTLLWVCADCRRIYLPDAPTATRASIRAATLAQRGMIP